MQQTKKKEEAQRQARYDALQKLRDNKQRLDEEEAELRKERSAINPKLGKYHVKFAISIMDVTKGN